MLDLEATNELDVPGAEMLEALHQDLERLKIRLVLAGLHGPVQSLLERSGVMDKIGDLTNILFVGGSAADDMKLQTTYVFANGKAHTNAAVLALLKPKVGFEVVKTQSFCSTQKVLKATRVNEVERIVYEFDG